MTLQEMQQRNMLGTQVNMSNRECYGHSLFCVILKDIRTVCMSFRLLL